jgi:hypothetical protein
MMAILLTPVILSFVVLAAHFLRQGLPLIPWIVLLAPFLLVTRQAWATRVLQAVLVLGALEWVRTAVTLIRLRIAIGEPWGRMAIILGCVALVTAASAVALQHRKFLPKPNGG